MKQYAIAFSILLAVGNASACKIKDWWFRAEPYNKTVIRAYFHLEGCRMSTGPFSRYPAVSVQLFDKGEFVGEKKFFPDSDSEMVFIDLRRPISQNTVELRHSIKMP